MNTMQVEKETKNIETELLLEHMSSLYMFLCS